MALEDLTGPSKFIDALIAGNPAGPDDRREGDDHIRGIKNVLRNTFPQLNAAVTATDEQLNLAAGIADGVFPGVPVSGITDLAITGDLAVAGHVGIGTSAPAALLHLSGPNTPSRGQLTITAADYSHISFYKGPTDTADEVGYVYTDNAGNALHLGAPGASGAVIFDTGVGSAERMRIDAAGNVGIGIAPVYPLHLARPGGNAVAVLQSGDVGGAQLYLQANSNVDARIGTLTNHALLLMSNSLPAVTILPTGSVGIGGNPLRKFHVWDGDMQITSSYAGAGATPTPHSFFFSATHSLGADVAHCGMQSLFVNIGGSNTDYSSSLLFYTSQDNTPVERMRIDQLGLITTLVGANRFAVALDMGGDPAAVPIGGVIAGTGIGAGFATLHAPQTIVLGGPNSILLTGLNGNNGASITAGTYRMLGAINSTNGVFIRTA